MPHPLRYLSARLFLLLTGALVVVFAFQTYFDIRTLSRAQTDQINACASRASDMIVGSTRHGMLLNRKEDVHETIRQIGRSTGFAEINVYNKAGEIIFSSDSTLIGTTVDLRAEACVSCHASDTPLEALGTNERMRIYQPGAGERVLGLINPIRNEPACYEAACHAHNAKQSVLGVLDVKMSLAGVDARVARTRNKMIVSAFGMTLLIATLSGGFIYRVVRVPMKKLGRGMKQISHGDLDARLDFSGSDEIGQVADRFNRMAGELREARDELREWTRTLEDRVAEKTRQLETAQAQIVHMEKMASLGKLSASVAHEINNPLFGILTYSKLIMHSSDGDAIDGDELAHIRKCAKVIHDETSRCGEIVKGLLDFARQTGGRFEPRHLNDIIEKTLVILSHHFQMRQIAVSTELGARDDSLVCDGRQLQQAIIAPCINAVEAMQEGGQLTLRTRGDEDTISLDIVDTGVGIPPDVVDRIFEPFFTTKEGESGLGLGLAVTYGVVRRHKGEIAVDSRPDQGTTVTITLPREPALEESDVAT